MRLRFSFVVALLTALAPLVAHADGISDFVLKGDVHTITFSLPTSYAAPYQIRPYFPYYIGSGTATIDGVPGDPFSANFFPFQVTSQGGGDLRFTNSFGGISEIDLGGPDLVSYMASTDPNLYLLITFASGTFQLVQDGSAANTPPASTPFTLTITPEASAVPEPTPFVFVATGLLCVAVFFPSRRRSFLSSKAYVHEKRRLARFDS